MTTRRTLLGKSALVAVAALAVLGAARPAAAANMVEGYVTYASPDGRYGYAQNALVEIVNAANGAVVDRRYTDFSGAYRGFCPAGSYYARAVFRYGPWTLRGRSYGVWFSGTTGRVTSVNVLVR